MIKKLKLENFRNHKNLEVELGYTTVIIGPNGAGKSNILEAVSLISFCRSYREETKSNLIHFESDFSRVSTDNFEICLIKSPVASLRAKKKGVVRKAVDFVGELPAVIFSPESFNIVMGGPNERRRFLDMMLSETSKSYISNLVDYNKIKKQRNHLLRNIHQGASKPSELDYWDKELAGLGNLIIKERISAIDFINPIISGLYEEISGQKNSKLEVVYQKSSPNLAEDLVHFRQKDIVTERSNFGPHRDDLLFLFNGRNMARFSSRGEIKSALLALKIAELKYLEKELKKKNLDKREPILLLDDVYSEFDADHKKHLSKLLIEYQTIITSADNSILDEKMLGDAKIIDLA